ARHINDRHLPDKAIDIIDEAGANQRLQPVERRSNVVTVRDIENIVAKVARIPPKNVSASDRDLLRNLERDLKLVIFGQDRAIDSLAAAIKMARSGLRDERRPIGAFLFAGPQASARPRSRASSRSRSAWSSCASTCPNTWSDTPCRGS